MKKQSFYKALSSFLCSLLIAAVAVTATGCGSNTDTGTSSAGTSSVVSVASETVVSSSASSEADTSSASNVLGTGATSFTLSVTDPDGKVSEFTVNTDKKTVGEALVELNVIAGDDSEFGLYVKTVNGITLDYDKDKSYWAFYIDGAYASTGVDSTDIKAGSTYSFKAEK